MARKTKEEDFTQEDYIEETPEEQEEDYEYNSNPNQDGEEIKEKTTLDRIYNPELILLAIEKTMSGYRIRDNKWVYVSKPVARDEFISKTINSLRSVINPTIMASKMYVEEIEMLLLEKNLEYIDMCEDEPTIDEDDIETVINNYDHSLQTFMGLVESGWGANLLKEISAGVAHESARPESKSVMETIKNVFS
jgi:hypothetical protein